MKFTTAINLLLSISSIFASGPNKYKHFSNDELKINDTLILYKEYLKDHTNKLKYTAEDIKKRHEHFKLNLMKLRVIRAAHTTKPRSWVAGLNNLSDYSEEELKLINEHIADTNSAIKGGALNTKSFLEKAAEEF